MAADVRMDILGEPEIVAARKSAREFAAALGFSSMEQTRITTAVSELARNVVRYATDSRGSIAIRDISAGSGRTGIEIVVEDEGPGIADIELAMSEGYTSGNGLGLGLSGTKRLMDEMELESSPGAGTRITIRKWKR